MGNFNPLDNRDRRCHPSSHTLSRALRKTKLYGNFLQRLAAIPMIKTKNAEVTLKFLIGGVIAVFILAMIFTSPAFMGWIANKLPNLLPDYNNTPSTTKLTEKIRYDLAEDNAQYYDGLTFNEFPSDENQKAKIGAKSVSEKNLKDQFKKYYYTRNLPVEFELPVDKRTHLLADEVQQYYRKYSIVKFDQSDRGNTYVRALVAGEEKYYQITPEGNIKELNREGSDVTLGTIGEIVDIETDPKISITPLTENSQYTSSAEHIVKINTQKIPLKELNDLSGKTLGSALIELNLNKEIKLENGYAFKPTKTILATDNGVDYEAYSPEGTKLGVFLFLQNKNGKLSTNLLSQLKYSSKVYYSSIPIQAPEEEIISQVAKWRDTVLAQPMQFIYENTCTKLNVKKITAENKVYLTTDLSEGTPC